MSRRYLFRTPQFGLLTLFAAMLLFVSAAGWFRFQYQLYQEEEEVLAAGAAEGYQVIAHRHGLVSFEGEPFYQHWLGVPYFDRIRTLGVSDPKYVFGAPGPAPDFVERAASLPFLEAFQCGFSGILPQRYPQDAPIPAPPRPEAPAIDVEEPLATGERLDGVEADELFREWRAAWSSPSTMPYGTQRIRQAGAQYGHLNGMPPEYFCDDQFVAYGPGGSMYGSGGFLNLTNAEARSDFHMIDGRFIEQSRHAGEFADYYFGERAAGFRQHATGRASLEFALQELQAMELKAEFVAPTTVLHGKRAYRVNGDRCRIDFAPIVMLRDDGTTRDELSLSAVFMDVDDYPLEAFDLAVSRTDSTGAVPPSEMLFRWRGALSRHADRYLVDAFASDLPMANRASPSLPLQHHIETKSIAYDLTPPPDSAFDPSSWNAIEFPDPRPLPFWRWYRATFAISVALFAYLALRRLAGYFGRLRSDPSLPAAADSSEQNAADPSSTAESETDKAFTG